MKFLYYPIPANALHFQIQQLIKCICCELNCIIIIIVEPISPFLISILYKFNEYLQFTYYILHMLNKPQNCRKTSRNSKIAPNGYDRPSGKIEKKKQMHQFLFNFVVSFCFCLSFSELKLQIKMLYGRIPY